MSEELESIGALSTATLAAAAIEGDGNDADKAPAHGNCANCTAPLDGPYCKMCGQPAHIHRSLLHLVEEALHGIFHFDAKGWRTIPLLVFSPGRLTRRYIDGQRKTYVSPLALFLFMVFLTFFVASFSNIKPPANQNAAEVAAALQSDIADATKELTGAKLAVAKASAALEAARKQGIDLSDLQETLGEAQNEEKTADADLQRLTADAAKIVTAAQKNAASGTPAPATQIAISEPANNGEDASWAVKFAEKVKGQPWTHSKVPAINDVIKHSLANPDLAVYKLKNTTYKFSFMLVPISLPFLWLMFFWRRGIAMFDHAVFVLYSLCFMSLWFIAISLLAMTPLSGLTSILVFAPPIHMFVQLRGAYGLSALSALWRTVALSIVAIIVLALFFLMVLLLSMH